MSSQPRAVIEAHGYKLTEKAAAHVRSGKKFSLYLVGIKKSIDFTQYEGVFTIAPTEQQEKQVQIFSGKELLDLVVGNGWASHVDTIILTELGLIVPSKEVAPPPVVTPSTTTLNALVYTAYDGKGASFVAVDAEMAPRHLHKSLNWHRRAWDALPGLKRGDYDAFPYTGTALVAEAKDVFTNFTGFFGHIGPDGLKAEAGIPVWTSVEV